jgi:histone-lysine N-methyltransferase EZH2
MSYFIPKTEEEDAKVPVDQPSERSWTRYTSLASESEGPPEITRDLVLLVYREVWDEFYAWERTMAERTIAEISHVTKEEPVVEDDNAVESLNHSEYDPTSTLDIDDSADKDAFTLETFMNRKPTTYHTEAIRAPKIDPYPTYESCAPSKISLGPRHYQTFRHEVLQFFPTVDHPNFSKAEFAEHFEWFAWQKEGRDRLCKPV